MDGWIDPLINWYQLIDIDLDLSPYQSIEPSIFHLIYPSIHLPVSPICSIPLENPDWCTTPKPSDSCGWQLLPNKWKTYMLSNATCLSTRQAQSSWPLGGETWAQNGQLGGRQSPRCSCSFPVQWCHWGQCGRWGGRWGLFKMQTLRVPSPKVLNLCVWDQTSAF